MSRDWRLYLDDILAACGKVERYTAGMTLEAFRADEKTFDAVLRNLTIVGEAAKQVPDEVRRAMPGTDWRKVGGQRDIVVHAYPGIDDEIVWDVVQRKLPELARQITTFLETVDSSQSD